MAALEADLNDLHAAIAVIESAAKLPARSRATNVGPFIEEISEHAYQSGLPSAELKQVIDVLTAKNELDQTSRTTLIRNLIPASRVESSVVQAIVCALGNGFAKPTPATQASLLRWITAIHDVLEEPAVLSRMYGILFNLLDLISIRTPLCQLLGIITRRKHVRPFRIQRLLTLCQQVGNDQALVSLLRIFKNFYPEIVISQIHAGRIAQSVSKSDHSDTCRTDLGKPFDTEWRARMLAVQSHANSASLNTTVPLSGFKVHRNGIRGAKPSAIPEVRTFHGEEHSITLEEINSASDFVDSLERIEPPSQLIAGLSDPLLRRYSSLQISADLDLRLDYWLERYLENELELLNEGFGLSTTLREILSGILELTEFNKQINPVVERFLMAYMPQWDGSSNQGLLLDLLAYLPPQQFQDLYTSILLPFERAILHSARNGFASLFDFYSKLVCNWMDNDVEEGPVPSQHVRRQCLNEIHDHISVLMSSALMASTLANDSIVRYLDSVSRSLVRCIGDQPKSGLPVVRLPEEVFYLLLFSSSLSNVSGLCAILSRLYRSILEHPRAYPATFTASLNTYLMDSCNVLYRARAFVTSDKNAQGCLCPKATNDDLQFYLPKVDRDYSLASMFGFSYHPLVSSAAHTSFKELEKAKLSKTSSTEILHKGPVGQRTLVALANEGGANIAWKEYRVHVLKWLGARGLNGIEDFLYAIIKDLSV